MKIKIATWNMAYWSHRKYESEAWDYLINGTDCDVFLTQESVPNLELLDRNSLVWNEIGGTRPWGTGIYSPKYKIREFPLNTSFVGSVAAAEIEVTSETKIIVISLYALMEKIANVAYSIPNLHRIFSDLTEVLEGSQTKHRVVLGGDFNASLQIDETQPGNSHRVLFDRLREFGLVNCYDNFFQDFVQTHRHSRSNKPWQIDYFFLSKRIAKNLTGCGVINTDTAHRLSDHNPVVIELEL